MKIRGEVLASDKELNDIDFQHQLLNGVSRSFAFTIPQLPGTLRNVVANAYLLFRIADTIEDENTFTIDQKRKFFNRLVEVISDHSSPEALKAELAPLLSNLTVLPEKNLIQNIERIIRITRELNPREYEGLKRSITLMCTGMEAFELRKKHQGLKDLFELNDYCYYVAGVVGEFLTDLFCEYSSEIAQKRETLNKLAVSFGQGLQMTNILKDLWKDFDRGVCWLPRDIFERCGFYLKDLSQIYDCDSFKKGVAQFIAITYEHLKNGLTYTLLLPEKETGIRKFCLWAIGLAMFTLRNIWRRSYKPVGDMKVSRKTVRRMIWITQSISRNNFLLRLLFYLSAIGLPKR